MGGDTLTDEEIEIILGRVDYPAYHEKHFDDIKSLTKDADIRISGIKKKIKESNKAIKKVKR